MVRQADELRLSLKEAEDVMLYGRPQAVAEEMARVQSEKTTLMAQVEGLTRSLATAEQAVGRAVASEAETREELQAEMERLEANYRLRLDSSVDASKELEAMHADRAATAGQEVAQLEVGGWGGGGRRTGPPTPPPPPHSPPEGGKGAHARPDQRA